MEKSFDVRFFGINMTFSFLFSTFSDFFVLPLLDLSLLLFFTISDWQTV